MAYIPNPADPTQPTGNVDASTADDEFRALKAYIQGIALAAGTFSGVRQCAQDGVKDANGYPAFLTLPAGGGLAVDLAAVPNPLTVNFAGGQNAVGNNDRIGYLTNNVANVVAGLDASNTDYIYADYVTQANWTWGKTLAPPQYGFAYDRTKQSVLQFGGAAGSTAFLDDFGNTWTAQGGAKVQTNQIKFGTGALGGGGAANVLNGAADYIKTAGTFSLGGGSWSMRAWCYPTTLPGAGFFGDIIDVTTAANIGARLAIWNNAGTIKFWYGLGSVAAGDIASQQGTTTPLVNTWYFVELTFDALAGVYRLYVNGAQEASTASAVRVNNATTAAIGSALGAVNSFFAGYIDKPEILPYCQHSNGIGYVSPIAAPSITVAGYASDFFDIQAMKMYTVTGISGAAAANPTLTQKYRLYLGEADTNGATAIAVRNYAYNGKYVSPDTAIPVAGTRTAFQANLGVIAVKPGTSFVRNLIAEAGWTPGMVTPMLTQFAVGDSVPVMVGSEDRNVLSIVQGATVVIDVVNRTTGVGTAITPASWKAFISAERGW